MAKKSHVVNAKTDETLCGKTKIYKPELEVQPGDKVVPCSKCYVVMMDVVKELSRENDFLVETLSAISSVMNSKKDEYDREFSPER